MILLKSKYQWCYLKKNKVGKMEKEGNKKEFKKDHLRNDHG